MSAPRQVTLTIPVPTLPPFVQDFLDKLQQVPSMVQQLRGLSPRTATQPNTTTVNMDFNLPLIWKFCRYFQASMTLWWIHFTWKSGFISYYPWFLPIFAFYVYSTFRTFSTLSTLHPQLLASSRRNAKADLIQGIAYLVLQMVYRFHYIDRAFYHMFEWTYGRNIVLWIVFWLTNALFWLSFFLTGVVHLYTGLRYSSSAAAAAADNGKAPEAKPTDVGARPSSPNIIDSRGNIFEQAGPSSSRSEFNSEFEVLHHCKTCGHTIIGTEDITNTPRPSAVQPVVPAFSVDYAKLVEGVFSHGPVIGTAIIVLGSWIGVKLLKAIILG